MRPIVEDAVDFLAINDNGFKLADHSIHYVSVDTELAAAFIANLVFDLPHMPEGTIYDMFARADLDFDGYRMEKAKGRDETQLTI